MHLSLAPLLFITVACINIGIGSYVFIHQPKRKANQAFFIFSLGASLWIGGFGLLLITHEYFFIPVLNLGGVLLIAGLFWLARVFSNVPLTISRLFYAPFFLGGIVAVYPGLLIEEVTYQGVTAIPQQGAWFPYYSAGFAVYALATVLILIVAYKRAAAAERERFQYFFLGIGIFVGVGAVCDLILPACGIFTLNFVGPLSSVISLCATAYAIVRHRLMDIRIVIQRSLIYSVLLSLIVGLYVVIAMGLDFAFTASKSIDGLIAGGITTLLSSFGIPIALRFFRKISDPIFFKDSYIYSEALEKLGAVLNSNLNFTKLVSQSLSELENILHPTYAYFIYKRTEDWFGTNGLIPVGVRPHIDWSNDHVAVIHIQSENRLLGQFVLGPKRSGDMYSWEDCTLLRTFASHATVAFRKAELHQELQEHSDKLEEKIQERTRDIKEMQEHEREFFDDVSHALQTPLTVLKSALYLLQGGQTPSDSKVYESMETSVDDLSQRVRNMLELSRIGTTAVEAQFEIFDLSQCLVRILEYVNTVVNEQGIELSKNIEASLLVLGNSKQIEEAITNILSNAVRYTEGCPTRKIRVDLKSAETQLMLSITDTGIGMASETQEHLFNRFYRVDSTHGPSKGFGLGLAITKRIVTSHGGSIEVQSTLTVGTEITVRLPRP